MKIAMSKLLYLFIAFHISSASSADSTKLPPKKSSDGVEKNKSSGEKPMKKTFVKPSDAKIKELLTDIQYKVTQKDGTERPFQNEYHDLKDEGIYVDVVTGEPLFSSLDKYDSGTGWPSFFKALEPEYLVEKEDRKLFSVRTEVRSKIGDSHLGHKFDDGPEPTGIRYCMNSAALRFIPRSRLEEEGYPQYLKLFQAEKKNP